MGVRFEVVQSAAPTSSGVQDFTKSGFGTPKAAILIFSNASVSGTDISDAVIGVGITDGIRQFATCGVSQNGVGTANTFSHITNSGCVLLLESSAGGIDGEASFDSWITDGLRINWANPPTSGVLVTAVLINGADLSAYVGDFTSSATIGNSVDITAPNFEPHQLIVLGAGPITSYNTSLSDMHMNLGFVDNGVSIVQCSTNEFSNDAATLGDTRDNVSSIYAASIIIGSDIEISGFDSQGFSAYTRTAAGGYKYPYLALAYGTMISHWVGIVDSPTATGNQSVVSPGFKPQFVLHCPNAVATIDGDRTTDATGAGTFSVGAFTATDGFTTSIEDQDTADPIRARSSTYSNPVKYDSGAGTNLHTASFVSLDPSGWTLNYTVANATVRKWPTLVVEESFPSITNDLDLFVNGYATLNDNIALFIWGRDALSDNLDLFVYGNHVETNDLNLFITTVNVISETTELFINGSTSFSGAINLFTSSSASFNENVDLYIGGLDINSESLDLFLSNKVVQSDINLFIAGPIVDKIKVKITQVVASSGSQDITIPGFDVVKAAIFIIGNPTAAGIPASGIEYSIGITDGIKSRATGFSSEEGLPNSNTQSVGSEDHLLILPEKGGNGFAGSAIFEEWIQDGIRINWDVFPSGDYLLTAIFFGGSHLDAVVDTFSSPSVTGSTINVDVGFEPDQLIGISNGFALNQTIQSLGRISLGFADNSPDVDQGSVTYYSAGNAVIGSPSSIVSSGIFARQITLSSSGNAVQISGFTSSGFIAETVILNGSTEVGFLALKYNDDRQHFVGFVDSPVTSGISEFTNPGFHPLAVCQSLTLLENLNDLTAFNEAGAHGLSVFTQGEEFSHSFSEKSSVTMQNQTLFDDTAINFPDQNGLPSFVASFDQMTASGWKLNFTSVDGSVRKWLVLAIEDPPISPASGQFDLFISGQGETEYWNLFLKTGPNTLNDEINLNIYGSPSGENFNFAGQGIELFLRSELDDSIFPPLLDFVSTLFLRVPSGDLSGSGYWLLFLASDTSTNNNVDLYISTADPFISDSLDLFIARIPDFPAQDGFTPTDTYQTLFLKTTNGAVNDVDLFIFGIPMGSVSGNMDFSVEGIFIFNDVLNLTLNGVSGVINNEAELFIGGIDTVDNNIKLYLRGC